MIRLHFVVEGQTEELFVNEVLAQDLIPRGIYPYVRCVLTTEGGSHPTKGGGNRYKHWRKDLLRTLKSEKGRDVFVTTMVDFYGLPKDFPGRDECSRAGDSKAIVSCLEKQFRIDLNDDPRFIPYIQLHEFEALLFAEPSLFVNTFPAALPEQIQKLRLVKDSHATVDEIDDGPLSSPSRRISNTFPEYEKNKPTLAALTAIDLGLERMSQASPHFSNWLDVLRKLSPLEETRTLGD